MRITHPATLRALIRQRGLSYAGLGGRVGCHKSFIGHLAVGRKDGASAELAERIAEALDVPIDLIFAPIASTDRGRSIHDEKIAS